MRAYKLVRVRKDGSLGPLFINARLRIPLDTWLEAESHPTKGYAYRPFWHVMPKPEAPHLSEVGRWWYHVEAEGCQEHNKPASQGGLWFTARRIKFIKPVTVKELANYDRTKTFQKRYRVPRVR